MAELSSSSKVAQLDHLILLLSPADFKDVPAWLGDNFHIIEGGTHSQGTSHNKLIIFQDGTYLELFSWVQPPPNEVAPYADFPSWADKPESCLIDFALTGDDAHGKYNEVKARLKELLLNGEQLNVTYNEPAAGGRRRKDGKELRWVTTRPRRLTAQDDAEDPQVPFFCHDISPRELRVPYTEGSSDSWPAIVTHPCGAIGVAGLTVAAPATQIESFVKLYEAILGSRSNLETVNGIPTYRFTMASPEQALQNPDQISVESNQGDGNRKPAGPSCFLDLVASQGTDHDMATSIRSVALHSSSNGRKGERLDGIF